MCPRGYCRPCALSHGFRYTRHLTLSGSGSSKTCLWLPHSQCNWNWIWSWELGFGPGVGIRFANWLHSVGRKHGQLLSRRSLRSLSPDAFGFFLSFFANKFLDKSHLKVMARVVGCRRRGQQIALWSVVPYFRGFFHGRSSDLFWVLNILHNEKQFKVYMVAKNCKKKYLAGNLCLTEHLIYFEIYIKNYIYNF